MQLYVQGSDHIHQKQDFTATQDNFCHVKFFSVLLLTSMQIQYLKKRCVMDQG